MGFWEADFVVVEDEGPLSISITASERISLGESLIMEVVPMTLGEYIAMNGHLQLKLMPMDWTQQNQVKLWLHFFTYTCISCQLKKVIWSWRRKV